ncbi:calcium-activated chloride channel regulator 1-like [Chanodichthys erythropterus]|uniref:calcium-activated chloride channel regulator 1-like n=1 Tax=Chanodichthys erythropterus TaxID=933992 RepID=UPI00351E6457
MVLLKDKIPRGTRTVIFEDSVDKDALRTLKVGVGGEDSSGFKVVLRMHRVVCLVLDVSGSMTGSRILRQQQAATHFLQTIIEDQASVGIVTFSSDALTLSPLTTIDSESTREKLIKLLPKEADGGTYVCKGLNLCLQVLEKDNGNVIGDEIIFLTDGEASDDINSCVPAAIKSGAIIHTNFQRVKRRELMFLLSLKKGRSSLKVRVKNLDGQARFTVQKRGGAPYVPGYVVNGVVELNPPKPPVSEESLEVGRFTRTATGESFEVAFTGSTPPNFPPNRITDLCAEIQEDPVLLSWMAPGEDLDQGTAKSYEIRWSYDLQMLRENFSNAHAVNTAAVLPQEAGSVEQHSFNLSLTVQNGSTLCFAVQSEDEQNAKSETSNIAQASKILPDPTPSAISNPGLNVTVLIITLCVIIMVICFVVAITTWSVRCRKSFDKSNN